MFRYFNLGRCCKTIAHPATKVPTRNLNGFLLYQNFFDPVTLNFNRLKFVLTKPLLPIYKVGQKKEQLWNATILKLYIRFNSYLSILLHIVSKDELLNQNDSSEDMSILLNPVKNWANSFWNIFNNICYTNIIRI